MKFDLFHCSQRNRSGIILVVVLWVMVILSVLAVGLGTRTGIDLAVTKHTIGKMKADALSWAAVLYALDQIQKDAGDKTNPPVDTLYRCAIKLEETQTPDEIFKDVALGEGHFDVYYSLKDPETGGVQIIYALADEERRININAVTLQNYKIFSSLLSILEIGDEEALRVASAVVDWVDADSNVANPPYGAEDGDYMLLEKPYHCKNYHFDSIEELTLVKGMTPEIFSKIKDYVTVFPKTTPAFLINVETAPEIVLRALGRAVAGAATNTEMSDADDMAAKIVAYRRGDDDQDMTSDDREVFNAKDVGLNAKETVIWLASRGRMTNQSRFLRLQARGKSSLSPARCDIEAVISRDDLAIVDWRRR